MYGCVVIKNLSLPDSEVTPCVVPMFFSDVLYTQALRKIHVMLLLFIFHMMEDLIKQLVF